MGGKANLLGERFDKLTVIALDRTSKSGRIWRCRCDCGNETFRGTSDLKRVIHTGCRGCESVSRSESSSLKTHGGCILGKSRLYRIWKQMRNRCANPNNTVWEYYGGKGIKVCGEWQTFEGFRDWAVANGYREDLTIDRVNPDWHYDLSNCEWVTSAENTRRARHPGHYWRSMTLTA